MRFMNPELAARLRALGVMKGTRDLKRVSRPARSNGEAPPFDKTPHPQDGEARSSGSAAEAPSAHDLMTLIPGLELVETADGGCLVLDHVYPLTHRHGQDCLADLLAWTPAPAAVFTDDSRLGELTFRDFLFLDTETTGLGGAGVLAFMVGVAFYEGDALVARQFFLRDHGDEAAMLSLLRELLDERAGLITFNGRSFDLPLLESRFLLNRMAAALRERPHVDLLPPARRLWRHRFDSCALSALERALLGLERTQEDVPGWMIPGLYNDYLRTGDGRELTRVFYHNRLDLLSMVTLAARVVRLFSAPASDDHPMDLFALGRWQVDLGLVEEAERNLRRAAAPELPTALYQQALTYLGYLLKRAERREEALQVWQQLACTSFEDVTAHVELAKHYEWHARDLARAQYWTQEGLALLNGARVRPDAVGRERAELEHRLARLQRKLERAGNDGSMGQ